MIGLGNEPRGYSEYGSPYCDMPIDAVNGTVNTS
jgi:hypothetical protein